MGFETMVRLLLGAGADPALKNNRGNTAAQLAKRHGRTACLRLLIAAAVKEARTEAWGVCA